MAAALLLIIAGCTTQQISCDSQGYILPSQCPICKLPEVIPVVQPPGELYVYYINVGQGESELIKYGEMSMLIDCGKPSAGAKVVDFIKGTSLNKLDYLIITHPDSDHVGGCLDVITEFSPVVITNGQIADTAAYQAVAAVINNKQLQQIIAQPGNVWPIGAASMKVIQANNGLPDPNENSVVTKLTYGNISFLFTGDCEKSCETMLLNKDINSSILKIGHHGTKYATSIPFLQLVQPTIAVISVNANNQYGHPTQETLDRLSQENVVVYRTDTYGTVTIRSDGSSYEVV